jgi:Ca2+:H+ antiporter
VTFTLLLVLVPLSAALAYLAGVSSPWTFASGIAAIVPLAEWVRRATEHLARRAGPAVGSLVNVTFGNTPELALAVFVLAAGHEAVVKAQITGSIIGNSLLGLGLSVLAGSIGRSRQRFNRARASQLSSLMILSTVGLLLPALFDYTVRQRHEAEAGIVDERLSLAVSIVLILVYLANLVYTLVTHRATFEVDEPGDTPEGPLDGRTWSVATSLAVLAAATAGTAFEAHLVSSAMENASVSLGVSPVFLGIIVLAVVGNAAEYVAAVSFARADRIGVSISITVGSTIQMALLVAPLLVVLSWLIGRPMTLVFGNPLELIAVAAATAIVGAISRDGETTWFEGLLLLAVYVLFGVAFFFL